MAYFSLLVSFLLLLCLVVVGVQNDARLAIKFLWWSFQMSLPVILFWACLAGAAIIALLSLPKLGLKYFESRRLRKEVGRLESLCGNPREGSEAAQVKRT